MAANPQAALEPATPNCEREDCPRKGQTLHYTRTKTVRLRTGSWRNLSGGRLSQRCIYIYVYQCGGGRGSHFVEILPNGEKPEYMGRRDYYRITDPETGKPVETARIVGSKIPSEQCPQPAPESVAPICKREGCKRKGQRLYRLRPGKLAVTGTGRRKIIDVYIYECKFAGERALHTEIIWADDLRGKCLGKRGRYRFENPKTGETIETEEKSPNISEKGLQLMRQGATKARNNHWKKIKDGEAELIKLRAEAKRAAAALSEFQRAAAASLPADWERKSAIWWAIGLELLRWDYISNPDLGEHLDDAQLHCPYGEDGWANALSSDKNRRRKGAINRVTEIRSWVGKPGKNPALQQQSVPSLVPA